MRKYISQSIKDKKIINYVQWNITRRCNYNCSYCSTKHKRFSKHWRKITDDPDPYTFLDKFRKHLSGSWGFYLCGTGEPFMTPRFLEIVKELVEMNHQIDVQTNFSMPEEKIFEFCKIVKNKLFQFRASLHLDYVSPEKFLKKALKIKKLIGRFVVYSVAKKGKVAELEEIGQIFRKKGITFVLQLERNYSKKNIKEPFVNYTEKEKNIIKNFRYNFYDKKTLKFAGNLCWAGSKYFVIDEKGEAYRCNPAQRFIRDNNGYLGNLLDDTFKLKKNPSVCSYKYCYCVQPIISGLILDKKNK